ncbi:DUF58 domain-containing protein [Paraglaciecola sp. 2405UD69-4]|uniref:DUF58 domain-containing protein n=1 Tax=Paraglaciecola sp. 2405UD69-4 TaxID=3391836 RepID=UPI0039C988C5
MAIIQRQFDKWLDKRIPVANQYHFNHKNIFILPSKFGTLFLGLCGLLFLLGTNYQNNLMLLLCYFLVSVFLVNLLTSYINFAKIRIHMGKAQEVYAGDNFHLPVWLNPDNHFPMANGLITLRFKSHNKKKLKTTTNHDTHLDNNSFSNPVTLAFLCQQRGTLTLPRITVESFYPLGLYRCWTHIAFPKAITVFPKPIPCDIALFSKAQEQLEQTEQMDYQLSGQNEFSHLKAYQQGDPLNHVAWKQLAKGQGMISKQFVSEESQVGWLSLDKTIPSVGLPIHQRQENRLSKLCYQVIELSRNNQTFGLDLRSITIPPNSGQAHRLACLTALATFSETL